MHQKCKYKIPGNKTVSYGLESIIYLRSETLEANPRWIERIEVPTAIQEKSQKFDIWELPLQTR